MSASLIASRARALDSIAIVELGDDFVEQIDLDFRIAAGAGEKKVGDARQHLDAMRIRAGGERLLELVDQRWFGGHGKRVSSAQGFGASMAGK